MEHGQFIGDFPIETSIHEGFSSQPCLMKPEGNFGGKVLARSKKQTGPAWGSIRETELGPICDVQRGAACDVPLKRVFHGIQSHGSCFHVLPVISLGAFLQKRIGWRCPWSQGSVSMQSSKAQKEELLQISYCRRWRKCGRLSTVDSTHINPTSVSHAQHESIPLIQWMSRELLHWGSWAVLFFTFSWFSPVKHRRCWS